MPAHPTVYRAIIEEVVGSLKEDFEEFGLGEDVLHTLRNKWEQRLEASRAADFSNPHPAPSNPHAAQYNGIGSAAVNNVRTGSPNINRTNSPASIAQSRGASRTNSIGSSNNPNASQAFNPAGTPGNGNVQVKKEPVERYLPGTNQPQPSQNTYQPYNPAMQGLPQVPLPQMPPNMNMGGVPPLNPYVPALNLNMPNAFNNRHGAGFGGQPGPGGPAGRDPRSVLMLPTGAAPYGATAAGNSSGAKMPQVDGTWEIDADEDSDDAESGPKDIKKRYPWLRDAKLRFIGSSSLELMPQVDGPTPATPPVPPLNLLPPLNLNPPSTTSGIVRAGGPPPLTLPPLNLPMNSPPQDTKALHPSLANIKPPPVDTEMKRSPSDITMSGPSGSGTSSFARNPNVPAQPSEDINSDLDDSEDEDGPQAQPGSDPDANVTYCTYDKVTRVKTKWKVVFRDGMVHANNKDYLFTRCTGEFDW
ncbi:TFIIA-domain-containing protein [Serendipita vermifera]|nr:TFIIA-domain-containing protein [Serendipita vermifera]